MTMKIPAAKTLMWKTGVTAIVMLAALMCQQLTADQTDQSHAEQIGDGLPQFDENDVLQLPTKYREWVFVGSSLGLRYGSAEKSDDESFGHVYINPFGYRAYRRTGEFPVGTVFMLEVAQKQDRDEPELSGSFAGDLMALEAAVKSGGRFDDPWTYFSFDGSSSDETPTPTARRYPSGTCIECHRDHAETDHVFTQFYPVLRDIAADD